jgi:hypothetical protein
MSGGASLCPTCGDDRRRDSGRRVENLGMYVGLAIAALYAIGEFLLQVGIVRPAQNHGVPWVTLLLVTLCVAPKTIGKATAGRAWVIVAQGIANWFSKEKG